MKRILVIRLGAIGDIVLATAAIEALARAFPDAAVEFLLKERFSALLEGHPHVGRLWLFDERGRHRGAGGLLSFMRAIQAGRFDLAVDLQGNLRSRLICRCLRAKKVLRWDKRAWQRRMMVLGKRPAEHGPPVYARYLEALKPLGIDVAGIRPRLYPNRAEPPAGLKAPYLAMAPGAHWPAKRWPAGHYAELAARIADETDLNIGLIGSEDDREAGEKIRRARPERIANLCGQLGLGQLASFLAGARAAVTNDTGPMHLAEAAGVPVLAFFGPTAAGFGFAPWREESRMLAMDLACRPCSLHGSRSCPKRHHRCLDGITPDVAWKALQGMLDG
ncbi:MAG TPA: hypothetical protein DDW31_00790 [candidate division Zixibacteria bacterium]|jgi:heptosyltransferase-2|nr:hypothetical protein [candidate division Zixibacteria bacterium]